MELPKPAQAWVLHTPRVLSPEAARGARLLSPRAGNSSQERLAEVARRVARGEECVTQASQSRLACGLCTAPLLCGPGGEAAGPTAPGVPSRGPSKTERCPRLPDPCGGASRSRLRSPCWWVPGAWASGFFQSNSLPLPLQHLQINWTGLTNLLDAPGIK